MNKSLTFIITKVIKRPLKDRVLCVFFKLAIQIPVVSLKRENDINHITQKVISRLNRYLI